MACRQLFLIYILYIPMHIIFIYLLLLFYSVDIICFFMLSLKTLSSYKGKEQIIFRLIIKLTFY